MILIIILVVLAFIHFYWALGGKYWIDKSLPVDLEGKKLLNPSNFITFIVGLVLLCFSYVAYVLCYTKEHLVIIQIGYILSLIFFLRVIGDFYMIGIFKKIQNTEFSKYDNWIYIPLSLFIALYFLILSVK